MQNMPERRALGVDPCLKHHSANALDGGRFDRYNALIAINTSTYVCLMFFFSTDAFDFMGN